VGNKDRGIGVDILGVWRLCPGGVQGYTPDLCP